MKIIADMGNGRRMCEVTEAEIVRLRGFSSSYDNEWRKEYAMVGAEIDLSAAYSTLDALRSLDQRELNSVGKSILNLQDRFDTIKTAHEKLMLFDTLKEAGKSNT
jgi:hypothetical protein